MNFISLFKEILFSPLFSCFFAFSLFKIVIQFLSRSYCDYLSDGSSENPSDCSSENPSDVSSENSSDGSFDVPSKYKDFIQLN